jgi:signal transduction histidine kinase
VTQIVRNGVVSGRAGLVLSLAAERARLERSRQLFWAYFALDSILLLGIGSFVLTRIVVKPINRLLQATEKITGGHYGSRIRVSGSSELARLAESFNSMSETLMLKDIQVNGQVTALERANADLQQAREETLQSEKMASIGLLAAGMAHEIGTPLASIMGYAELLTGEHPAGSASHDYAARILQDSMRIDRIVRGLLDYSRTRANLLEPVDVKRLVLHSVELLSHQGALKGVEVTTGFDDALPQVKVDPHQLEQVLINLMLNSRDAMPDGGTLRISAHADDAPFPGAGCGAVRIDVMDNGCGIPLDIRGKLFDPFFTTKQPGKGTGLGLAIAARIMEGFGGRISVKSTLGKGSCFSLLLPALEEGGRQ